MKYASVCSGVEAASLAWMPLGWEAVWFSEIEPFPCAVLQHRFPNVPNLGDMTKIRVETLENGDQNYYGDNGTVAVVPGGVDLLVGGTPCQGFSVAGKQGGLEDDRSVLCLTFVRLLKEMRPRFFVWENVPGVLSTAGGADFFEFIRQITESGYCCAWRILDAQYVRVDGFPRAVPQRRRRMFVVGCLGADWELPAKILFEPQSLLGDTPPRRVKGKGFTTVAERGVGETGRAFYMKSFAKPVECDALTVTAHIHKGISNESPVILENQSSAQRGGNEQIVCYENHANDSRVRNMGESCQTLNSRMGTGGGNLPLVQDVRGSEQAVAIAENIIGRQLHTGGNGPGFQEELAYTQNTCGVMGVAVNNKGEYYGDATKTRSLQVLLDLRNKIGEETFQQWCFGRLVGFQKKEVLRQKMYEQSLHGKTEEKQSELDDSPLSRTELDAENALLRLWQSSKLGYPPYRQELAQQFVGELNLLMQKLSYQNTPYKKATVRRLLPIETERLMGFPDNWTKIPYRGKSEEDCPDSPRYKACGNSMCVNVMRWIGKRIDTITKGETK